MNIMNKGKIGTLLLVCSLWSFDFLHAQTVMQVLSNNEQTMAFAQALQEANLDEQLNSSGPFTLFVPTNEAFDSLPNWQKTEDDILLNHIFIGLATARSLKAMSNVTCLSGKTISINGNNGNLSVGPHGIIENNIRASNGVIHIINGVIK